jgi:hypothetical protein
MPTPIELICALFPTLQSPALPSIAALGPALDELALRRIASGWASPSRHFLEFNQQLAFLLFGHVGHRFEEFCFRLCLHRSFTGMKLSGISQFTSQEKSGNSPRENRAARTG